MAKEAVMLPAMASWVFEALPHLTKLPSKRFWVDYDEAADVLYVTFDRPQRATDTRPVGDHFLLRYRGRKLVGITVLHTSTLLKQAA